MMSKVARFAREARKFLVALGALVASLVAAGILSGEAATWVSGVIGALGAFLIYYVPNAQPDETPTPEV